MNSFKLRYIYHRLISKWCRF